ncbi:MAG: hypothetical protein AB7E04_08920 [Desulfobacteraceae bacterium]
MITTIICSGRSEAEKSILETALKYKIETKGFSSEISGINYERFALEEVSGEKEADFKNIECADGLIYLSACDLPVDDWYTEIKNHCIEKNVQFCFLDINSGSVHQMSDRLGSFVFENGISCLMFKTDDTVKPDKTDIVKGVFESLLYILLMKTNPEKLASPIHVKAPDYSSSSFSVKSVVEDLMGSLPLKDRVIISNMHESELPDVLLVLGITILSKYYWPKNNVLLDDCMQISGKQNLEEFEIAEIIIKKLWERLKATHRIRILK